MNKFTNQNKVEELRKRAEQFVQLSEQELNDIGSDEIKRLMHELMVHQVELEMQNDELQQAQFKVKLTKSKFEALFNLSPVAYLTLNSQGMIQQYNQAMTELSGYSGKELKGRTLAERVDPRDRVVYHVLLKSALRNPEKSFFEFRLLHKSGQDVYVRLSVRTLEETSKISGTEPDLLIALTNISDIKEAHEKLKLSATVYKAIGEAIMVANTDNLIVAINPAFTKTTGYSEREAIGQSTKLLRSGLHDQAFYHNMWFTLEKTGHWQGEIWNRRKSGEVYLEWLTINTIYDDQGEVLQRVAMFSDITEKKQAEQTIWQHANFDPLTNLPNRRMVQNRLEQDMQKHQRIDLPIALLLLDLDRFKEINDTLGHNWGDVLLQEAASRIKACVRKSDTVGRLGGDEFTIILCELDDINIVGSIAQNILRRLAEPFQLEHELSYISASIGITLYPIDAKDSESLFKNADQAMYTSKGLGRNCFTYFTPSMQEAAQARMRMINDLRTAVTSHQFLIHYQPIVELATGVINKAEALIRWQHPFQGLISPNDFISIAEETGLINDIGSWVLSEAVQQVKHWQQLYNANFQISVNMSPVQLRENNAKNTTWFTQLSGQSANEYSVVIEITEGLLLKADDFVNEILLMFRNSGIQVSIDDFGTGYSSLSYIKKFDIDYIKIDKSFVNNIDHDSDNLVLCEAIILMAHKLGMKVIAEGIETKEQCELLFAAGCDYGQGYFLGRPHPVDDFESMFLNNHRK